MMVGSLYQQLLYPRSIAAIDLATEHPQEYPQEHSQEYPQESFREYSRKRLWQILQQVDLAERIARSGGLDGIEDWSKILSIGEQQRLAFARLLLLQPQYALLDEATSALDAAIEARLYSILQASTITFISVGHRPTLIDYHHSILHLYPNQTWKLTQNELLKNSLR
jgi:putative ATP-binding cassette transporter